MGKTSAVDPDPQHAAVFAPAHAGDARGVRLQPFELELLAGQPSALLDLAQQIARTIAVMPVNVSKSERGYAMAQDGLDKPL
ncbi:MAG: hypothetical protein HGA25_06585, partial [Clostridiales bacterium]|nr:hypothetical protein [Clostridiales bacterium]